MSFSGACTCKPRNVVVLQRKQNRSAFNGYHVTPSNWSHVACVACGKSWRTKAKYVDSAPDAPGRGSTTIRETVGLARQEQEKKEPCE